jgi:phage-related protein
MAEKRFLTRFCATPAGAEPVREFLRELSKEARQKCGGYMSQLEWQGLSLPTQYLQKLSGNVWELRPEYGGVEYRLYFGIMDNEAIYCHAISKKQQKAAQRDIELAQRRLTNGEQNDEHHRSAQRPR